MNSWYSNLVPLTEPIVFEPLLNPPLLITSANTNENNANAMIRTNKIERCLIFDKIAIFILIIFYSEGENTIIYLIIKKYCRFFISFFYCFPFF